MIPVGRPIPNYTSYVLDDFHQSIPLGETGQLYVGGAGVFAGYLGRDDLTSQVLLSVDGNIFYKTGDLVRMDDKGLLYFVGRKDHQIKLRGQRIELGEIEHCLLKVVSNCVLMKYDDQLIAYVEAGSEMDSDRLRAHCEAHLPRYMIPSCFIILERFPLNANGKI
ncbi:unnamed protein product, partial [Rotaria sp. Silwood1]